MSARTSGNYSLYSKTTGINGVSNRIFEISDLNSESSKVKGSNARANIVQL
jgi:hypothetical protein